ncbi:class I SAM-dependent methyltransferase [Flindersiella endophytica]
MGSRVEGRRWYGVVYRTFYRLGLTFWERGTPTPELVELVESGLPPGRAIDIGCGTGTESTYLAEHGWTVTGVDMVPKALAIARRKARKAGVSPTFVQADATRLPEFGIGDGYQLVFDYGCFHTLPTDRRDAYVESVTAIAAPGATFLLFGFQPAKLAPMRAGLTEAEVRERFCHKGWTLDNAERKHVGIKVAGKPVDELFELWGYRLIRKP